MALVSNCANYENARGKKFADFRNVLTLLQ